MAIMQEFSLLKLEIDASSEKDRDNIFFVENDTSKEISAVEFEILPVDSKDEKRADIANAIAEIDDRIDIIEQRVSELNTDIDRLTNHADGIDYTIAVASGVLTGLIDSFFVGEFDFKWDFEGAKEWSGEKVENFVIKIAKKQKIKDIIKRSKKNGNILSDTDIEKISKNIEQQFSLNNDDRKRVLGKSIRYLEKFGLASDSVEGKFGGGLQHHLRDFTHHPNLLGLICSIISQFTGYAYGTDAFGNFQHIKIEDNTFIGENLYEKIFFGVIYWFLHMASDIAGSQAHPGEGTGLPGPIVSMLKEISALPIFKNEKEAGKLKVTISKLFNGTLLAQRDENGKIIKDENGRMMLERFDLRAELAVAHELKRLGHDLLRQQSMWVIINEILVRAFYFIRHFIIEYKEKINLEKINWKNVLPFKNRTIVRMMTIATGTFTAIDMADAAIRSAVKSGGITNPAFFGNFVLRVNFVGIGRFVIAVGSDIGMGIKKLKSEKEKMQLCGEELHLLNAKVFYKEADMWISAEETGKTIEEIYVVAVDSLQKFINSWNEIQSDMKKISGPIEIIREKEPDFIKELEDTLEWGI